MLVVVEASGLRKASCDGTIVVAVVMNVGESTTVRLLAEQIQLVIVRHIFGTVGCLQDN
jgi:hypothetical protein